MRVDQSIITELYLSLDTKSGLGVAIAQSGKLHTTKQFLPANYQLRAVFFLTPFGIWQEEHCMVGNNWNQVFLSFT